MDGNILLTIGPDGEAELYDDTYDITIHCTSQEEHDRAVKMMETANRMKWQTGNPTEAGYYNIKFKPNGSAHIKVETDYYNASIGRWRWFGEQVIKWCPIPEDEEDEA